MSEFFGSLAIFLLGVIFANWRASVEAERGDRRDLINRAIDSIVSISSRAKEEWRQNREGDEGRRSRLTYLQEFSAEICTAETYIALVDNVIKVESGYPKLLATFRNAVSQDHEAPGLPAGPQRCASITHAESEIIALLELAYFNSSSRGLLKRLLGTQ